MIGIFSRLNEIHMFMFYDATIDWIVESLID